MSTPFVGEIRLFAGTFPPDNWRFCDGSVLPIESNTLLFSLISNSYGGDGITTFALPDLRGRVPVHYVSGDEGVVDLAGMAGEETTKLTVDNLPEHNHTLHAVATSGIEPAPTDLMLASFSNVPDINTLYSNNPINVVSLAEGSIGVSGEGNGRDNIMPSIVMNYMIALSGNYPTGA